MGFNLITRKVRDCAVLPTGLHCIFICTLNGICPPLSQWTIQQACKPQTPDKNIPW